MNDITTLIPHIKLRFAIDYPNLEECYTFGYESALADLSEGENPYQEGTKEYEQWLEGWWAGFYGEKPLFESEKKEFPELSVPEAANDQLFCLKNALVNSSFLLNMLKITGAIAATAVVGYQVFELVA